MRKKVSGRRSRKKEYSQSVISIVIVLVIALAGGVGFLKFYHHYIDETLYAERLSQMKEVTTQLYSGLEDVVENQWRKTSDSCRKLIDQNPETQDDFQKFMEKQGYLEDFKSRQMDFLAVDQNGKYYTESGTQGLLPERKYLASSPERVSFVSNSLTYDESKMLFLQKLSIPVILEDGKIQIQYFGISQDMEQLNPYFNCKAYGGNNSVYVTDSDGLKLFSSSSSRGDLLNGFNVYNSLGGLKYLHGSSFEDTRDELDKNGLAYSNALLKGEEIYYSLYKMDHAEWVLVFLVPSQYVAMNTVRLINVTIRLVMAFAVILVLVCVITIFLLMKKQQELALAAEKKNNEILEKVNKDLKIAAEKAERATKVAEAASRAKTDFLANMSHDIRTPMNAIVGITSLMEYEKVSDKLRDYIEKVQLSSRHLLGLINDILDMSRIESNEVKLNEEHVNFAEQIGQIDSIIRSQANEHHQNFHIYVNQVAHEYLICDGVRLRQIFLNLLSNAVKYTPDGGNIVLDLAEVPCEMPGYAKFIYTVTDNGYGMTQEFVQHIFEPFTRAENSVTNKVQGTGLGMAITKNIVDLMGGEIHVTSEIGKGSCFEVTVTLPIDTHADHEVGADRVLLISDEERLLRNMKASMSESQVQLYTVSSEKEAEEWLTQESVDVILMDGALKNKNLRETVRIFREKAKKEVLIFCVDYTQEGDVRDMLTESGIDGMLSRPFFLSNLALAIARTRTNIISEMENESILNGMNFLCAEDNELNAEILKEILEMYGASCTIYPDGEKIVQAFKKVTPGEYDAILMDVQMPNMNGLEAAGAIRSGSNPLGKTIPIIAMTANAFSEDVQHCMSAGMDAHIAKPLDIAVLEKTLRGFASGGGGDSQTE